MEQLLDRGDPRQVASEIMAEIHALPVRNSPNVRVIRRKYSRQLRPASPEYVLDLARALLEEHGDQIDDARSADTVRRPAPDHVVADFAAFDVDFFDRAAVRHHAALGPGPLEGGSG